MAKNIEALEPYSLPEEIPSDHIRSSIQITGWAVKLAIGYRCKLLKKKEDEIETPESIEKSQSILNHTTSWCSILGS